MSTVAVAFKKSISGLVGRRSYSVVAGWGSWLSVDFEPAHELQRPSKNKALPDKRRRYIGEVALFIREAAWRLRLDETILVGSYDNLKVGRAESELRAMEGRRVRSVDMVGKGLICVDFGSKLRLEIFPIVSRWDKDGVNFSLMTPTKSFRVGPGGKLTVQKSDRAQRWTA